MRSSCRNRQIGRLQSPQAANPPRCGCAGLQTPQSGGLKGRNRQQNHQTGPSWCWAAGFPALSRRLSVQAKRGVEGLRPVAKMASAPTSFGRGMLVW